jgi:hypothetical protein
MNQRTSQVNPVSAGLARTIGQMVEAAALKYNGGAAKLELVKGDPEFQEFLFQLWDARAIKRTELLAFTDRPAWKVVKVGGQSKEDLIRAVKAAGHKFSDYSLQVINNKGFTTLPEEREIELFTCTVAELGFANGACVNQIYVKLAEYGFDKCPDETALYLRMAYTDQPMNEWRIVISEPYTGSDGCPRVLDVGRSDDASWVNSNYAYPAYTWDGNFRLVFRRNSVHFFLASPGSLS